MNRDRGRRYWDRHARNYDLSMRLFGGPLPEMLARVTETIRGSDTVLEIAAGTGIATAVLSRAAERVVASDYAGAMVERLRERIRVERLDNVEALQADVMELPFLDGDFDAVVATNLLHLVPDVGGALASMARVLRPQGLLLVPTYCHGQTRTARLASRMLRLTGFPGRRRLTLAALTSMVGAAEGLEIVRSELLRGLLPIGFVSARKK